VNRIGIDMDGCLADFNTAFINLIIKETGEDLFPPRPFDITEWHYPQSFGYTNGKHLNKVWKAIEESDTFWETLKPLKGAQETIIQLYGRVLKGDDVYFITTRPSTGKVSAKHQTEKWLMNQTVGYLDIWADFYPTVLVTSQKGAVAQALNLTHLIDDKWENCVDVEVSTDETQVYLLDRSWNQGMEDNWIQRVGSVMDMIKELD
jgi:hypothetical protein